MFVMVIIDQCEQNWTVLPSYFLIPRSVWTGLSIYKLGASSKKKPCAELRGYLGNKSCVKMTQCDLNCYLLSTTETHVHDQNMRIESENYQMVPKIANFCMFGHFLTPNAHTFIMNICASCRGDS